MITAKAMGSERVLSGGAMGSERVLSGGATAAGERGGWLARRREAARRRLLERIDGKLARVLRAEESVVFACKGALASRAERFFAGHAVAYHVNLRALVFTTERVILMQISAGLKPRGLVSELPYALIRGVRSTWSGFFEVRLGNGETHRFSGIPRAERRFLEDRVMDVAADSTASAEMEADADGLMHRCPHCFAAVPGRPAECPACGGRIKSAGVATVLSALVPGAGDWYLGHRGFAVVEMLGAGLLWWVLVGQPVRHEIMHRDGDALGAGFWIWVLGVMAAVHVVAATITWSFARKGHHPG
jgi:hypothetical protein